MFECIQKISENPNKTPIPFQTAKLGEEGEITVPFRRAGYCLTCVLVMMDERVPCYEYICEHTCKCTRYIFMVHDYIARTFPGRTSLCSGPLSCCRCAVSLCLCDGLAECCLCMYAIITSATRRLFFVGWFYSYIVCNGSEGGSEQK